MGVFGDQGAKVVGTRGAGFRFAAGGRCRASPEEETGPRDRRWLSDGGKDCRFEGGRCAVLHRPDLPTPEGGGDRRMRQWMAQRR